MAKTLAFVGGTVYLKGMSKECIMAVEIENDYGYRRWHSMPASQVDDFIASEIEYGNYLSDVDHSTKSECDCECMK